MRNTISLKVKCSKAPGIIHISCSQWLLKQFDPLPSSSHRWSKKHESLTAMYSSFIQFLSKRRNNLKPTRISDAIRKKHPKPNRNNTMFILQGLMKQSKWLPHPLANPPVLWQGRFRASQEPCQHKNRTSASLDWLFSCGLCQLAPSSTAETELCLTLLYEQAESKARLSPSWYENLTFLKKAWTGEVWVAQQHLYVH